jgi:hypothetical protein
VRFDRSGAVVDTAGWRMQRTSMNRIVSLDGVAFSVSAGLLSPPIEYDDGLTVTWAVAAGAARGSLSVVRRGSAGDTLHHTKLDYAATPIPAAFVDSIVQSYSDRFGPRAGRAAVEGAVRDALSGLPAHHPPISTLRAGVGGAVWLRRSAATSDAAAGFATWIVYAPEGGVLGRLELPATMSPNWTDGRRAWVVDRDAFDVPWLVRIAVQ